MSDAINPDHYKRLPAEAIEIIESAIQNAPDNIAAYNHGQQLKYDLRLFEKGKTLREYLIDQEKHCWYSDRLREHLRKLVEQEDKYEQQKASDLQSLKDHPFGKLKQPKWTPKIGDWVRIKKPADTQASATSWWPSMDRYNGQVIQVEQVDGDGVVYGAWSFLFDWLEQVEPTLYSDKIPEGYRKLKDSSEEPRQLGDLRWSVSQKRYVEITVEEIGYANRDNWAACRKVETVIKQPLNTEPPDGWRWLERGEPIRKGDKPKNGDAVPLYWIGTPCCGKEFILRRNRFEVGEKVVHVPSKDILEVVAVAAYVSVVDVRGSLSHYPPELLAPYIEETK